MLVNRSDIGEKVRLTGKECNFLRFILMPRMIFNACVIEGIVLYAPTSQPIARYQYIYFF